MLLCNVTHAFTLFVLCELHLLLSVELICKELLLEQIIVDIIEKTLLIKRHNQSIVIFTTLFEAAEE